MKFLAIVLLCVSGAHGQADVAEGCPATQTDEIQDCSAWYASVTQDFCESKNCLFCEDNDVRCYLGEKGCVSVRDNFKKVKTFPVDENFPGLNLPTSRAIKFFMTGIKKSSDDAPTIRFNDADGQTMNIYLGAWGYSKSAFREAIDGKGVSWPAAVSTPGLYEKDKFKPMWAQWNVTHMALGYGDAVGSDAFMSVKFAKIRLENVESIAVTNKNPTVIEWKICRVDFCQGVDVASREDCGYPGISEDECLSKNCCFDNSIVDTKWCFYPGK